MLVVAYFLLGLGGLICAINIFLSFILPLIKMLRRRESRTASGFPIVGSFMVVVALVGHSFPAWLRWMSIVLALLDTGGIHWFLGTLIYAKCRSRSSHGGSNDVA